ncbi:hypothetical protein D1227_08270 [Henriciella mobilis]|uniref:hypothetical protein n=1 Tax=Henriciella mobilis TaxID=2305467 RepID=UPI000E66D9E7|nr:hypothetical protein [Henriciella mobilis]RIJ17259.1 hypothetical protein D1231_05300 [Henriciella mobilis]RIJ22394.1 hypothetical protein D1227_08270 [Henriciella mobilis]
MSEHVLKLDPPAFGPDRNFLPDAVFSEDVVMILSDGSESAQAIADAFASVGASVAAVGPDLPAAKRVSGIAAGHGRKSLEAAWAADPSSLLRKAAGDLGPINHMVSVNVDDKVLSAFLKAFEGVPSDPGMMRNCVIISSPSKSDQVTNGTRQFRINHIEVDLCRGAEGLVGRAGGTFELGWAVAFFCSPYAREIDGQRLRLDGGMV